MRVTVPLVLFLALGNATSATAAEPVLHVWDLTGAAAHVGAPVSVDIDVRHLFGAEDPPAGLALSEIDGAGAGNSPPIPVQFERHVAGKRPARLWWLMPERPAAKRRFRLLAGVAGPAGHVAAVYDPRWRRVDLAEGALRVLRYNQGDVPVPAGTHPHFAPGESYERGDYIHPLFGPSGEEMTEDYPRDHPHHRGVWWSWPVTRWQDQVADIWAVVGVWARPAAAPRIDEGPVMAVIEAENLWKFGKSEDPIVREEVLIRAFRQTERCRYVDVEVRLTALADGVAISGRPKAGYGGFALRAAPCEARRITLFADPEGASPRRAWIDYSGVFSGAEGTSGVAIFEHVGNPDYPNPLHQYPECNCVMPAYPATREVPLSKDKPLVLKHRLWIHTGGPDQQKLADVWATYAAPPRVTIVTE